MSLLAFAMRKVNAPGDIYPVFRELFAASDGRGQAAGASGA